MALARIGLLLGRPGHLGYSNRVVVRGHEDAITWASFRHGAQEVVTLGRDATLRITSCAPTEPYGYSISVPHGHFTSWAPDGRLFSQADFIRYGRRKAGEPIACFLDPRTGKVLAAIDARNALDFSSATFSRDGRRLIVVYREFDGPDAPEPVRVYDVATGKELYALKGLTGRVSTAEFSPDGLWLLTASTGEKLEAKKDGKDVTYFYQSNYEPKPGGAGVRLWNAETGAFAHMLLDEPIAAEVCWRPGTNQIFAVVGKQGSLWDATTGQRLRTMDMPLSESSPPFFRFIERRFNADGSRALALTTNKKWVLWDPDTVESQTVPADSAGGMPYFSPDGHWLVQRRYGTESRVLIWNVRTHEKRMIVTSVGTSFSPDARLFAVSAQIGKKEMLRILDLTTDRDWLTIPVSANMHVSFSPDGKYLLDGQGFVWPVDPLEAARVRKSRELTSEERNRFGLPPAVPR